ncbi:PIR protein [Plasmodium ovale]|uniref:PIR protein n=1 Tax=Plasmodium ovale TaxID=36330 RepID=A0A1D3JER7_PLAOA|nr:PIR protein [Plasmodium ovale]
MLQCGKLIHIYLFSIPQDPKYEHLPSYIFYEQLNSDINEDDEEVSEYWDAIEPSFDRTPWVRDVFFKLERNLTMINENRAEDNFSKKHCYDLNFWLYEQVYKNFESNENDENFYKTLDLLIEAWTNINNDKFANEENLCHPDPTLVDMEYLKEIKYLFDFIEDFIIIKTAAIKDTNNACYKYLDYLKKKVPIYYEWKDLCTMEGDNICTRYIDDYVKFNPKNVLENLSVVGLALASIFNDCYQNVINLFTEAEKLPARTLLKHRNSVGKLESTIIKTGRALAESGSDPMPSGSIFVGINAFVSSLFSVMKGFNSYVFNLVTPVSLSLLGILMLFYILYKFSSLRQSIYRTHKKIKNKFGRNKGKDEIGPLSDCSGSLDSHS